jgi:hypothetical protein
MRTMTRHTVSSKVIVGSVYDVVCARVCVCRCREAGVVTQVCVYATFVHGSVNSWIIYLHKWALYTYVNLSET